MALKSLVLCLLPLATLPAVAQAPYQNPVIGNPRQVKERVADPHVLKYNGEYYLYTTGNPITAFHSTDLVNWTPLGAVLTVDPKKDQWNQADVWAPEVVYRNGKFYMYYSATRRSPDWRIEEMARRGGVAVSDTPRGPFVDSGAPVTPGWAIDGHILVEPDTGEEYFFYSYFYEPRYPGAGIVVDRMTSRYRLAGQPTHVTRGSEPWEDKDGDHFNGSVRYTNEGPTAVKHNGRYYMMYSGGSWDLPTYAMAYASSPSLLLAGGLEGPGWTKSTPPFLRSTTLVEGPGHNCLIKGPNNVDDFTLYHARVVPFQSPGDRLAFLDRLYWMPGRMHLNQPSLALLAAPAAPLAADRFDRADGALGGAWKVEAGEWAVKAHAAAAGKDGRALLQAAALNHYVFEANLRQTSAGKSGVAAWRKDNASHADVWLDAAARSIAVRLTVEGRMLVEKSVPVPADFRFDVYHQLMITKNAARLNVALDEVNRLSIEDAGLDAAGQVALLTLDGAAEFDGVALSAAYDDNFDKPQSVWKGQSGAWMVDEGELHQVAGGASRAVALKGDEAADYEFTASLKWREDDGLAASAGIVAAASGAEMVLAGFNHTIWPYARFEVRHVNGAETKSKIAVEMPRGFNYASWHTLRVVKHGGAFTFYLDGEAMVDTRIALGAARPGLYTEGARAEFDDAAMTRLGAEGNLLLDASFDSGQWQGTRPAQANVWTLEGGAQSIYCCGHSGVRQVVAKGAAGSALQTVPALAAGSYGVAAFASLSAGGTATVTVNGKPVELRSRVEGLGWSRLDGEFTLAEPGAAKVEFKLNATATGESRAAIDDVFLYRR